MLRQKWNFAPCAALLAVGGGLLSALAFVVASPFAPVLCVVTGAAIVLLVIDRIQVSHAARRYRSFGLSHAAARDTIREKGLFRWRERDPRLTAETRGWYSTYDDDGRPERRRVDNEVKEAFEVRMEGFRERLGDAWYVVALSTAYDVRAALENEYSSDELPAYYLDLLEDALPCVEDTMAFAQTLIALGLPDGCEAAKSGLYTMPLEYLNVLYPGAPRHNVPMSKTEWLHKSYGVLAPVGGTR